jgi:hypothetical protein
MTRLIAFGEALVDMLSSRLGTPSEQETFRPYAGGAPRRMSGSGGSMTKGTSRASKPRKSATKSPPKAGTKAKPGASEDKPVEPASRLIDQRIRDLGDGAGRPWPACGR